MLRQLGGTPPTSTDMIEFVARAVGGRRLVGKEVPTAYSDKP